MLVRISSGSKNGFGNKQAIDFSFSRKGTLRFR